MRSEGSRTSTLWCPEKPPLSAHGRRTYPREGAWRGVDFDRDLERFLAEDLGAGDVTTQAVARGERVRGRVVCQEDAVVAGLAEASAVFARLGAKAEHGARDGDRVATGAEVLRVQGPAEGALAGERLALNFLMRMSGIATSTRRAVDAAHAVNPQCEVAATRKTTPGFRSYEKRAVLLGGGGPHRQGLWEAVLLKDNHLALAGSLEEAVHRARERTSLPLEVEAETEADARRAVEMGVAWVLLDNWTPRRLAEGVPPLRKLDGKVRFEASGGILPEAITAYAPWVDRVSLGALTHSPRAVHFSLELSLA
jgi:nicotinate-nucleotide pyrophosphorylase (carboxylating)